MDTLQDTVSAAVDAAFGDSEFLYTEQPNTPESENANTIVSTESSSTNEPVTTDVPSSEVSATDTVADTSTIQDAPVPDYLEGVSADEWKGVPESVRKSFDTVVGQVRSFIQEVAPKVQTHDTLVQILEPHREVITKEGVNPLAVVDGTLQLAQKLWTGAPEVKADTIAGLIESYGVDIAMLEQALLSRIQAAKDPVQTRIQAELAPVHKTLNELLEATRQQQQAPIVQAQQQKTVAVQNEIQEFATAKSDTGQLKHPHFAVVRTTMGDIFDMAARGGETITLDEAYRRACIFKGLPLTTDPVKKVGLSVKGAATTAPMPEVQTGRSVSEALDAAFEFHNTQH